MTSRPEKPEGAVRVIRPATAADLLHLAGIEAEGDALFEELLGPEPFGPEATTAGSERAAQPGFLLVAAEDEGSAPIGFAHVLLLEDHGMERTAHLEQLAVRTARLRRGHGRALTEAAVLESRRRGRSRVTLRTYADIPWNRPFYEACGFQAVPPSDVPALAEMVRVEEELGLMRHGPRVLMERRI